MRCTASSLNCEVRGGSARFEIQVESDGTPSCETHVAQNPKQTAGASVCVLDIHTRFRGGYVQRGCAMHRVLKTGRTLEFENLRTVSAGERRTGVHAGYLQISCSVEPMDSGKQLKKRVRENYNINL